MMLDIKVDLNKFVFITTQRSMAAAKDNRSRLSISAQQCSNTTPHTEVSNKNNVSDYIGYHIIRSKF